MNKSQSWIEPFVLIAVPLTLAVCAFYDVKATALLTALTALAAIAVFFLRFEHTKPKPRNIVPIVVMAAIAAVGRIIFAPFPNFKPVTAIVILTAVSFGPKSGFMTGALAALASNLFFGQGPWTPWQMYAWGLVGYLAGTMEQRGIFRWKPSVYLYGFLAAFLYGVIMDSWNIIGFVRPLTWQTILAGYGAGTPFNLSHAISTVVFLIAMLIPFGRELKRIKTKFNL